MSAPLCVSHTPCQCQELRTLCRNLTRHSRERDRVECLLPFDRGLKVPALAAPGTQVDGPFT